jgi:MFS family permease
MSGTAADIRVAGRPVYYGWVVLGVAALAMVGTLPGRTQGLGLITEPLLRDFSIDRVRMAEINLLATLVGSMFCFGIGGLIDKYGSRIVLTTVALSLGAVVIAMSNAHQGILLILCVTLTRGFGQSALSIVSLAMPGKWFRRRLTWAMGVYALVMSMGFMLAFPAVGALVLAHGWRMAWAAVGIALAIGLAPLAWLVVPREPETNEELAMAERDQPGSNGTGDWTLGATLRSAAFWVFGIASALYGLVASGIGLFNESILAERGFPPEVYHSALAVTAIAALAGNFAAGAWADRGSLRGILVAALVLLTGALIALPHVSTITHVVAQAIAMGVAGGFVMVVFFSFWGRAYGRTHLGRIQGVAQALTVLASAIGPLLLAWCVKVTGSYAGAFYVLAVTLAGLAVATIAVRLPPGARAVERLG